MDKELRRAAQVKSTEVKLSLHLLAISPAIDVLPAEDQRGPSQRMKLAASPANAYHCIYFVCQFLCLIDLLSQAWRITSET